MTLKAACQVSILFNGIYQPPVSIKEDDTRTKYLYLILSGSLCNAKSNYLAALLTFYGYKAIAVTVNNHPVLMGAFLLFRNDNVAYSAVTFRAEYFFRLLHFYF